MSNTRRNRQMLRQSLTQHVFHYYEELRLTMSDEEAKQVTADIIEESLSSFIGENTPAGNLSFLLEELKVEWLEKEKLAIKEKDYDMQLKAMDILQSIKILSTLEEKERD